MTAAFPFSELCLLFESLEAIETTQPLLLPVDKSDRLRCTAQAWFKSHRAAIDTLDNEGSTALLSTLLPERRPDRVYNVQATSLCRILCRCLKLGTTRTRDLHAYKQPGRGDLGECVRRVLNNDGPPALPPVTLEDVDGLLSWLASQSRFSDPTIEKPPAFSSEERDKQIGNVFKRLRATHAKWLVRLILKDLSPVVIDEALVLKSYHFLMPDLLRFQNNFRAATTLLKTSLRQYHSTPDPMSERLLKLNAASSLRPAVGVKVSRPYFDKARSIEHCMKMLGSRKWVVERKYDGEYCEIHIDIQASVRPFDCIKIFSKSGKVSTCDRRGIHETLVRCLRLGQVECKIKRQAILLGELVAWSDKDAAVLPFEEIRKHVTRSGRRLGADHDSPPSLHEHLCIVLFDILLLDNEVLMTKPVEERRQFLREVYVKIPGRAKSAEWKVIDFRREDSKKILVGQFAASNAQRCEGLIMKPCGVPYFLMESRSGACRDSYIKLKKDYIAGLGDEADFAVIGASYDAQQALKSGLWNPEWTSFHLGALRNKFEVDRFGARPVFKVVGTIQQESCIPRPILEAANAIGRFMAADNTSGRCSLDFDIELDQAVKIKTFFKEPFVFELLGSGYQKPSNCRFFMLRHARVKKLHEDRSWRECVSFDELQNMAHDSRSLGVESETQEMMKSLARLEKTMTKKFDLQKTPSPKPARSGISSPSGDCTRRLRLTVQHARDRSDGRRPLNDVTVNRLPTPSPTARQDVESKEKPDGATLVASNSPSRKRERADLEVISSRKTKRRRETGRLTPPIVPQTPSKGQPRTPPRQGGVQNTRLTMTVARRANLQRSPNVPSPRLMEFLGRPTRGEAAAVQQKLCSGTGCVFANAIVYPIACISKTPYIVSDLLDSHAIAITSSLSHWARESGSLQSGREMVGESQAYPGMQKIVLVESKRREAVRQIVRRLLQLNGRGLREAVEIWDWRVMEAMDGHRVTSDVRSSCYLGATRWDDSRQSSVFAPQQDWLR